MANTEKYLQIRVTPELHTALRMEALRRGMSVKAMVTGLLQAEIDKTDFGGEITLYEHTDGVKTVDNQSAYPTKLGTWGDEPPGNFCSCADPDCDGTDHR